MALKPSADSFPELLLLKDTRNTVPCRGAWRQSCEAFGVSLGGAASSADLGCSSEYSTAEYRDYRWRLKWGRVSCQRRSDTSHSVLKPTLDRTCGTGWLRPLGSS